MIPRLAITTGEPAGIGPEIALALGDKAAEAQYVLIGDRRLIERNLRESGRPDWKVAEYDPAVRNAQEPHVLTVLDIEAPEKVEHGVLNKNNGKYVTEILRRAGEGALKGEFDAIVTCPVQKGIICDAGIPFTGHTEFFRDLAGVREVVMMLATDGLRVPLVTTHVPIRELADTITSDLIKRVVRILNSSLIEYFDAPVPRIFVCGLNPHAGENGHLGHEEIDTIIPALEDLRKEGIDLAGPLPADTVFQPKYMEQADSILAMYHDQGLPVPKYRGFGHAVNITLGLPFIRTSVDHGTALDLAGTFRADTGSLFYAVKTALEMVQAKKKFESRS